MEVAARRDESNDGEIERAQCVTLSFDKDRNPTGATSLLRLELPFVKSGESRGPGGRDEYATEERLGPLRVADHGMRVAPDCGLELQECRQFLFRKFADNIELHTLTLSPTYIGELGVDTKAAFTAESMARQSMLHGSGHITRGVNCFFSHAHHGFMYDVTEETTLVADYLYPRETNFAAVSQFLLYVSSVSNPSGTGGGVDVYTIRNTLANRAETAAPPDVSFLCQKFLFSPVGIDVAGRNVCVMVSERPQGGSLQRPLQRGSGNEPGFNLYALRTSSVETMVNELLELGLEFAESNWPYYNQILLEAHYLLRAKVAATQELMVGKASPVLKRDFEKYSKMLQTSYSLLGDHNKTHPSPSWGKVSDFYSASALKLSEIVARMVPGVFASQLGVRIAIGTDDLKAAQAALTIFRKVLFDKRQAGRINDTPKLANIILNVYWMVGFEELSSVILDSQLTQYTPEFAINLLKSMPPGLKEDWAAVSPADSLGVYATAAAAHSFALGLLYLMIGDMQTTLKRLSRVAAFLQKQCIEKPHLLFEAALADPLLPEVCAGQAGGGKLGGADLQMTALGRFLGDHAPAVLSEVLLGLGSRISVASGIRALLPTDEGREAVWPCAIKYLAVSLEAAVVDSPRWMTCTTFLTMLLVKQLDLQSREQSAEAGSGGASTAGEDDAQQQPSQPTFAAFGTKWERPEWLDTLPPFLPGTPQLPPHAADTVRLVQGLLYAHISSKNASSIYTTVSSSSLPPLHRTSSHRIPCRIVRYGHTLSPQAHTHGTQKLTTSARTPPTTNSFTQFTLSTTSP
jgi:hypothetical protein